MADDHPQAPSKAQSMEALTRGAFGSSVSSLSGSSRAIPSNQDFHFYLNFDEFRFPIQQIAGKTQSMLESVGSSSLISGKGSSAPKTGFPEDTDDAYDRLVDVNDAILERFDASVDEFQTKDDGFQLVVGKKKKAAIKSPSGSDLVSEVKVLVSDKKASGPKTKVPFHIPSIRRPQEEFNIFVNNENRPFEHVWLQRAEDGQRFVHPLENVSVLDFVGDDIPQLEPQKPPSVESTSFKLIQEVKDLKELAAKLRGVNEFAVDLEHNQYRSFQGLTCLIQISTRTEDFIIDALKLRIHIGPYLREVFKDPTKRKVMHGADRDIVWLQRDFGIYICNLFDTGQASRVLKMERNSLEYLLHHFCGVTANKEYQNADWRLRPLPEEMLRYARDDTHYLLYIYDLLRIELITMSKELESPHTSLLEVYQRSYDICMQLYEKELLTEDSFLYIYGLQGAGLNSQQLAIVSGLCEWRDAIARAEDESTGYILPNKILIEIAKQMPLTTSKLRHLVKSKHPYIEHNLGSVVSIIKNSMQNAAAFEAAAALLKDGRVGKVSEENLMVKEELEVNKTSIASAESTSNAEIITALSSTSHSLASVSVPPELKKDGLKGSSVQPGENGVEKTGSCVPVVVKENLGASEQGKDQSTSRSFSGSGEVNGATVLVQKKPSRAFGALLGNSITKKRFDMGEKDEQESMKLKQIRASVHFPVHSLSNMVEESKPDVKLPVAEIDAPISDGPVTTSSAKSDSSDVIMLQVDTCIDESRNGDLATRQDDDSNLEVSASDIDKDEPMSLSDLSLSFQQCLNAKKKSTQVDKSNESVGLQLNSFDYEEARKQIVFGERLVEDGAGVDKGKRIPRGSKPNRNSDGRDASKDDENAEFSQGRRRKAFPATGNRSATFR